MVLAPVARERKGEFADQFAALQAQGYVRFRRRRPAARRRGHYRRWPRNEQAQPSTWWWIGSKVRPDAQQRPGEIFETRCACRRQGDRAEMDSGVEHRCSAPSSPVRCAAMRSARWSRACSRSTRPVGACPSCDGLGVEDAVFDPRGGRLPTLSLASGAISLGPAQGATLRDDRAWRRIYGFDPGDRPGKPASQVQQTLLYWLRRGGDRLRVPEADGGRGRGAKPPVRGIRQLSAAGARPTATRCARNCALPRDSSPSPACDGARLRREAPCLPRRRRAAARDLPDQPCHAGRGAGLVPTLRLQGAKAGSPTRWCVRSPSRLKFPQRRGALLYLSLDRSADALGRRGQRIRLAIADRLQPDGRDVRARRAQHRPAPARQRPGCIGTCSTCATSATA